LPTENLQHRHRLHQSGVGADFVTPNCEGRDALTLGNDREGRATAEPDMSGAISAPGKRRTPLDIRHQLGLFRAQDLTTAPQISRVVIESRSAARQQTALTTPVRNANEGQEQAKMFDGRPAGDRSYLQDRLARGQILTGLLEAFGPFYPIAQVLLGSPSVVRLHGQGSETRYGTGRDLVLNGPRSRRANVLVAHDSSHLSLHPDGGVQHGRDA